MEILILVLLYYLSQNPDFSESVRPLMTKLKNSEQMLNFLKDLANFTNAFGNIDLSAFQSNPNAKSSPTDQHTDQQTQTKSNEQSQQDHAYNNATQGPEKEKNPQSPTSGIADAFIQNILDSYLNKAT